MPSLHTSQPLLPDTLLTSDTPFTQSLKSEMFSPLLVLPSSVPDPLVNPYAIAAVITLCHLSSEGWNAPKQYFAKFDNFQCLCFFFWVTLLMSSLKISLPGPRSPNFLWAFLPLPPPSQGAFGFSITREHDPFQDFLGLLAWQLACMFCLWMSDCSIHIWERGHPVNCFCTFANIP